ncbi:MAG TPA: hypothetical protein PLV68_15230, partial [Ilumatobacteraceae bacterium]|nr:hypothetical protein [Ilumatobacteraceae bacterium]
MSVPWWRPSGPTAALDLVLTLIPQAERALIRAAHFAMPDLYPPTAALDPELRWMADDLAQSLGGWLVWVSRDATAMIRQAARTIPPPDGAIASGVIPQPRGTFWFDADPLEVADVSEASPTVPLVGLTWTAAYEHITVDDPLRVAAVTVFPWAAGPEPFVGSPSTVPLAEDAARMIPTGSGVTISRDLAAVWDHPWADTIKLALAAWVMCGQILPQHIISATRAQRRRAGRLTTPPAPGWGDVHVTTLRRHAQGSDTTTPDDDEARYHHQWIVSGHWRWQPCG